MSPESKKKLVLITGAGASTFLGRKDQSLPMMGQWSDAIIGALDKVERNLAEGVHLVQGLSSEAFERTLGEFLQLQRTLPLIESYQSLGTAGDPRSRAGHFGEWWTQITRRIPQVTLCINETLWHEFGLDRIDPAAAVSAYRGLTVALGAAPGTGTQIFSATTNYDRSAELAWHELGYSCDDGGREATAGATKYLAVEGINPWLSDRIIPHLHLHGAVGWYRQTNGAIRIEPADREFDNRSVPAVLYPDPDKDPYSESNGVRAIWNKFEEALASATHILVLGHSLHDRPLLAALAEQAHRDSVRFAFTYLNDEQSIRSLLGETALGNQSADVVTLPVLFGPDASLGVISEWINDAG